jgi:hypothetical protein
LILFFFNIFFYVVVLRCFHILFILASITLTLLILSGRLHIPISLGPASGK